MAIRQSWKFEKDAFGQRHRRYFLENVFGADVADMKTFRALKTKLEKDYLGFFNGLDKSYERGEFKKMAKESVGMVLATLNILSSMIDSGNIDAETVGAVVNNVGNLNASKDFFVAQSEEVKALRGRMDKVEQDTGISAASLNISKKVISKGARREQRKLKEGAIPFLKRTMPHTVSTGASLATAAGVAALGPMFPIAKMAAGAATDIFGLGKGIAEKFSTRGEKRAGAGLVPSAYSFSQGAGEKVQAARGAGTALPRMRQAEQRQSKAGVGVLKAFFNKGAYQAKWTKALLKETVKAGKKKKGDTSGLLSKIGAVGKTLIPMAITAVTAVATVKTAFDLKTAVSNYNKAKKYQMEAERRHHKVWMAAMERQTKWAVAQFEKNKVAIEESSKIINRITGRDDILSGMPSQIDSAFSKPFTDRKRMQRESTELLYEIKDKGAESLSIEKRQRFLELAGRDVPETQVELLAAVKALAAVVGELSKGQKVETGGPGIREPSVGNPFDQSDPLIVDYSKADLSR